MWEKYRAEDIVGQDRVIDKLQLVRDFLQGKNCIDVPLTSPEELRAFLKEKIASRPGGERSHIPGVYSLYNEKHVFHVGMSKNLKNRIKEQFIGVKGREPPGLPSFARLFMSFLKEDHKMIEKSYMDKKDPLEKKIYIKSYQNFVFKSNNRLRVCIMSGDLAAYVLEQTLTKYFKGAKRNECKYDRRVAK